MVAGLLIRGWSAVRASLAMVVDLLLMHRLSVSSSFLPLVCLLLCHWSAVALSAGPSAGLVESWVRVSLVHRWSICSCIVGLSATLPVVCLLARHSSIRSGHVTRASARVVVARLSVRVVVTGLLVLLLVCCSCVVGHGRRSVIRTSLVRLLDSSLVCRWCVVGVSLVCRWCVTDLSLTCLFVCLWPVAVLYLFMVTDPWLIRG